MMDRFEAGPPAPDIQTRRGFSLIWIIPLIAVLVAGALFWRTLAQQGPAVTLTFLSADGLTAGQTKVRHKAVDLGTVERIDLSPDMSHVIVGVRMRSDAASVLTNHAQFWVVRPRGTPGNISGLETIVSGSYIELDPGVPGGTPKRSFTGLETPPAVRSDEPGRTYVLSTPKLGSIAPLAKCSAMTLCNPASPFAYISLYAPRMTTTCMMAHFFGMIPDFGSMSGQTGSEFRWNPCKR
jgi:paraquat-inducible protein B